MIKEDSYPTVIPVLGLQSWKNMHGLDKDRVRNNMRLVIERMIHGARCNISVIGRRADAVEAFGVLAMLVDVCGCIGPEEAKLSKDIEELLK